MTEVAEAAQAMQVQAVRDRVYLVNPGHAEAIVVLRRSVHSLKQKRSDLQLRMSFLRDA